MKTLKLPDISFGSLGEFRMEICRGRHREPFNCSIRNREELKTERIEMHSGEELHACEDYDSRPLLRLGQQGYELWVEGPDCWLPVRQIEPIIVKDSDGILQIKDKNSQRGL